MWNSWYLENSARLADGDTEYSILVTITKWIYLVVVDLGEGQFDPSETSGTLFFELLRPARLYYKQAHPQLLTHPVPE